MKTITSSRVTILPVILILCCACALILTSTASSEGPKNLSAGKAKEAIRMFDVGLGPHAFNFELGRDTKTQYLGSAELRHMAQSEQAQPRSMVSDDFNGDGMGDLVIGYASGGGGMLGLRQGNLQAIAPTDPGILDAVGKGRYPSPFLPEVALYSLPEAPDFLQVGDFDSDGYADVMAAARGGQRMYLLAGDGRGHLKDAKAFEVAGLVTAMQAGREQRGRFTSLALGLAVPGGAALSVYQEGGDGLASAPQSYTMPSEVTALAYGDLNQDGTPDVAAAARNEVAVVYQNANGAVDGAAPKENAVERTAFPFNVRGLTIGNFVFDRGHQMELALQGDDGTIHLADKGSPDRRPFTAAEIEFMRQQHMAWHKGQQDMDSLTREMNKLVSSASKNAAQGAWAVTETLNTEAALPYSGAPGLLQTAKISGLALDDLLVGNAADNSVQVVKNKQDIEKLKLTNGKELAETTSIKLEGSPLAAVSMRVSINGLPGMVVLHAGQMEPVVSINSPTTTYTTTTFTDFAITPGPGGVNTTTGQIVGGAGNGQVSLRSAVIASNFKGGSNVITLQNGTYSLTQGPFDDEFNGSGGTTESGDLDIIDLQFGGFPALIIVTINGAGRDTTIIQMGTLSPAGAGGINKDRVMETNNFVLPQHGTSLTLTNLTVQNGNAPRTPAPDNYNTKGGGIQFDGFDSPSNTNLGVLTLTNTKFTTNTSAGQGGGILAIFGGLTVQSTSIVSANTTTFAAGGGIQHSGGNVITTTFTIDNSTIGGALVSDGNTAGDASFGSGGGIDSVGANAFNITGGSVVRNNTSGVQSGPNGGGGVHIGNSKNIVFSTSTISDNKAKHNGGGIWVSARDNISNAASTITMTTMNVNTNQADSDNTLVGDGGGLYTFFGNATVQTTSHIDGNSAINGGGIFTGWTGIGADPTPGLTVQTGCTIGQAGAGNGNSAKNNGGSIAMNPGAATTFGPINLNSLTFTNSTANSDNSGGGDGGAIFVGNGNITSLNNCTIDSNVANGGTGDGIKVAGGSLSAVGTINVNGGDSVSISGGTFTSTSGALNITGNLLNSGGTFTHNSGTVNMNGSSAQTIGGTTAMTFNNLTINNAAGVNLGNNETVSGTLNLTNGVLGVGTNTLTLNGPVSFVGGSGSISSSATGTVSYNQGVANQNVAPGTYGNLTFNAQSKVLPNGFTVGIAGTFTTGGVAATITGSTVDFNGAGAQTIPLFAYNNLTSSNVGARTLAAGTIGVAGTFTPGTNAYTITGNTMDFNGAGAQTVPAFNFNNLTVSNTHGANSVTLVNGGTIGIAGTFTPGTSTFITTGNTVNFNGAGAQTIPAFNFNNLTVSNTHGANAVTLVNGGTIGVAGTFTPGTSTFTITSNTMNFNGAGVQTVPAFNFNNLTISNTHGANAVTLVNGGSIGVAGTFTPGTSTFVIAGNTVNFNGAGAQTIPAFDFNDLTVSNTHGANAVTLVNGGTIGVAGTFTPGTSIFTIANNTMNFNGAGAQTVAPFNYHHLTISGNRGGAAITLGAGNIGIAGTFTPSATNNTWVNTGNTIIFNGTSAQTIPAFDFFGGLTLSNITGATMSGNVTVNAAFTLTSGAFGVDVNSLTLNGAVSATAGTLTSQTAGTVNYFQAGAGQAVLVANYGNLSFNSANKVLPAGIIGIAGTFVPGAAAGHTITGNTINFNGAGSQGIPGFTYNNLTSSGGAAARTLDSLNVIKIAGVFTPGTNLYTITGSTIEYNGSAAQSLPATFNPYNNLTLNNAAGTLGFAGLTVNGLIEVKAGTFTSSSTYSNVQIDSGATLAATAASTINVSGNWANNGGTFSANTGTVNFNGSTTQIIGGTVGQTFNNLTNSNTAGLTMNFDNTVNGALALTSSDITVAATKTLTQPAVGTSSGTFDVNGRVQRNGFVTGGATLSFGNPNNQIKVTSGTAPANIVVDLARSVPGGAIGYPTAVQRTYTITPSANGFTGTLRLHYLPGELNGNTANLLNLWRFDNTLPTPAWRPNMATSRDCASGCDTNTSAFWVEKTGVSQFSPWTLNSTNAPTAGNGTISGRVTNEDGTAVAGAVVNLNGSQSRKTISDAQGNYRFADISTDGFYTVTPTRANYDFSPASRSFSQLGNNTDATFTGTLRGDNANPLDTAEYFVRQQYVDILGREPDEAGFNYWSNQILSCNGDQDCTRSQRVGVAAAFFIENEFRQSGAYIYDVYESALGRRPAYAEYSTDRTQVVGGSTLDAQKQQFAAAFVGRAEFVSRYENNLSADSFVDALVANAQAAGINLSNQRDSLISRYNAGTSLTESRAFVLRDVSESSAVRDGHYNSAFVVVEYFGYLHRNPEPAGLAFWVNVLNNGDPGNYRGMVCSFVTSTEYQHRFSAVVSHSNSECGGQ
jgi:hypothetical protein